MTPFEIDILLHYYVCAEEHRAVRDNVPIWNGELRQMFVDRLKLLQLRDQSGRGDATYECTARGEAYCRALQLVPLPEQTWVVDWRIAAARSPASHEPPT